MENVKDILEKLYSFYKVTGATELSEKMGTTPQTISNWKTRNSVNAVKKKCRELLIYENIFEYVVLRDATDLVDRLMEFYGVETISELAKFINVGHQSISRWRTNNSIEAIKKKSRELGLYNYLFDNFEVDLFKDLEYDYYGKVKILEQQCKKYNIQCTNIKNKRLLYLIEKIDEQCDDEQLKELEDFLKEFSMKSSPYYQYLDEKSKSEILEDIKTKIDKFENENSKN